MIISAMKCKGSYDYFLYCGGIGFVIFCDMPENEYNNTRAITASLIKLQLEQKSTYTVKGEEIC